MRIVKAAAVLVAAALGASAVALAVDQPAKQDDAETEQIVSLSGALTVEGNGYRVAGRELGLGPPWWRDTGKAADFDGDGAVETIAAELEGLTGKSVTVTGEASGDDELGVRTIAGKTFREQGRPPWAGGPKRGDKGACKGSKRDAKAQAKAKGRSGEHGPPPWARARGLRGC